MASFITQKRFTKKVLESSGPVMLIFGDGGSLEKVAEEKLTQLAAEHKELKVYKVNRNKEWDLVDMHREGRNTPIIVAYKDGKRRGQCDGWSESPEEIWALLEAEPPTQKEAQPPKEEEPKHEEKESTPAAPSAAVDVTADNFDAEVLQSGKKVLVYFWLKSKDPYMKQVYKQIMNLLAKAEQEDKDLKICLLNLAGKNEAGFLREYHTISSPIRAFENGEFLGEAVWHEGTQELLKVFEKEEEQQESKETQKKERNGKPDYNEEYFYMRPGHSNYASLTLWGKQDNIFWRAEPISEESLQFVFDTATMPKNPQMGDGHYVIPGFVVSQRVKERFDELNLKDVQFVPATIKDDKGQVHEDYYAMHVYNAVRCADLETSEWRASVRNPDRVMSFDKLVLDNEALDKVPLEERLAVMVDEQKLTHIYHRTVVDHLLKIQPEGIRFYSIAGDGREAFVDEMLDFIMQD